MEPGNHALGHVPTKTVKSPKWCPKEKSTQCSEQCIRAVPKCVDNDVLARILGYLDLAVSALVTVASSGPGCSALRLSPSFSAFPPSSPILFLPSLSIVKVCKDIFLDWDRLLCRRVAHIAYTTITITGNWWLRDVNSVSQDQKERLVYLTLSSTTSGSYAGTLLMETIGSLAL